MAVDLSSLRPLLSPGARIDENVTTTLPLRLSEYKAPQPGGIVHPATEKDVQTTVQWAIAYSVPFLVQNGGNGWATTFKLNHQGILIQLDQMRAIAFNVAGTEVTVSGGALVSDVVTAASARGSLVTTGTCNCVGQLGAILGGGFNNLVGQYGLGIDNLLALNVVTPDGLAITIKKPKTASAPSDLWWAMRGAGPNFGVVTSAVMKAYPVGNVARLSAWTGPLVFRPDQLEAVISALRNLSLTPLMAVAVTIINAPQPSIFATLFYHGSADAGRAAFKVLFDIKPVSDFTAVTPYTDWNAGSDTACIKGGRRPTWAVGLASLDPLTWRKTYTVWAELSQQPGAERSSILLNVLPLDKVRSVPDAASAYPFRNTVKFFASLTASYSDPAFDATAVSYGQKARAIWQATDGLAQHSTYINNAFGDENLKTIYGDSLPRLRLLKQKIDPHRRFNEWFPLS
ncbi:FAD binding domain-containing protein [Melanomma pulvis-pyrius CBS 109.77]|uniref:FAD binding domain-containing protein n=1 Tax=Melanomma pulvis-pyrius CBS 109.77 TaxID=1314802 RepID=A0A6A6WUR6_9PLEO|nr:FAD binding domain-containing protein [Melanomma pulvis-pyrius CBS 109.77]